MLARLSTIAAATAAGIVMFGNPAFAVTPVPDCHGIAVSDPAGDQYILTPATGLVVKPTTAIDITGVFLTGSAGAEKLNIRVADLTSSPNVEYTFRWNDPAFPLGDVYWELQASFFTAAGASGSGTYTLTRNTSSTFTVYGTTGRTFTGPNGVVQFDLRFDVTSWPSTFFDLQTRAEQYESNAFPLNAIAIRTDTANASSWAQPC